ncbi:MAG TPA: hypothetical protein VNQ33_03245, partial [Acidimicrobiales bacterium]|nr:hypothetical protein [Acidimicrobiales bacterium]
MPQAAPAPPPAVAAPAKPKGAIGIWIGVLLIVVGIVLGIVLVVAGVKSFANGFNDLQHVPINGAGIVRIEGTGSQSIYAERPTSTGGTTFNTSTGTTFSGYGPNVAVRVIGPDGRDVAVRVPSGREDYRADYREGVRIGKFDAPVEGEYRIVSRLQDPNGNWDEIAVGHAIELSGIGTIAGGIFGGGLIVLIGIIVVIIFAVRRSRSKKQISQGSAPYPGAYGAPMAGWPAGPGYAPPAAPGYGSPAGPAAGAWSSNPGWVPPPVAPPGSESPGPTWSPPPPPAPQAPAPGSTWQPPTAPP